jgi:hypothetical protein
MPAVMRSVRHTADDGTAMARERCQRKGQGAERKACLMQYLSSKAISTAHGGEQGSSSKVPGATCEEPSDKLSTEEQEELASCLHKREAGLNAKWLHEHLWIDDMARCPAIAELPHSIRRLCVVRAGEANWTDAGLVDDSPECGRSWLRTGCARELFAGRDALFIGNSVIRRQMCVAAKRCHKCLAQTRTRNLEIYQRTHPNPAGTLSWTFLRALRRAGSPTLEEAAMAACAS